MTRKAERASKPKAADPETRRPSRALMLGRWVVAFSLLASAGLFPNGLAAAQATASQGTSTAAEAAKTDNGEDLATIIQSRSTNTRAYNVVIQNDGSATAEIGGATQQFPPGTVDTKTLRSLLAQVGDVSRIPIGFCAKSVSFGTKTEISYAGKTSGDLQCVRQAAQGGDQGLLQASESLAKFVQTTLGELKVNDRGLSPRQ